MQARHYESLDAVRGVCALLVLVHHSDFLSGTQILPLAHLAVDMFFMMSGFVIGLAYDAKLRRGGFFPTFVARRFFRLAPMWAIGLCLGVVTVMPGLKTIGHVASTAVAFGVSLAFIPNIFSVALFPLNQPGWSLFFELVANFFYAIVADRLTKRRLVALVFLSACSLVVFGVHRGTLDGGAEWPGFDVSLARVFFSFLAGLLIYRHEAAATAKRVAVPLGLLLLALVIVLAAQVAPPLRVYYELGTVLVGMPAFLLTCVRLDRQSSRFAGVLGRLSYPLYCTHVGLFVVTRMVWGHFAGWATPMPAVLVIPVMVLCVAFAVVLGDVIDPWAQDVVKRRRASAVVRPGTS